MSSVKKVALQLLEKVVRVEVKKDKDHDFPICLGIFHQPKRPQRKK